MNGNKSREAAIDFLQYLAQKGLMAPATAQARKAALNVVLSILDDEEAQDVTAIDLDSVIARFGNLQGKEYTPESLRTYKSRVKSALEDFTSYIENPLAFKPSLQTRERKPTPNRLTTEEKKNGGTPPTAEPYRPPLGASPMANSILPIAIRADLTVYIQGIPFDLTEAEAKKIAGVVQAMAT